VGVVSNTPTPHTNHNHTSHPTYTHPIPLAPPPLQRNDRDDALSAAKADSIGGLMALAGMRGDLGPGAQRAAQCLASVPGMSGGFAWVSRVGLAVCMGLRGLR
jgi:hypothetical protein